MTKVWTCLLWGCSPVIQVEDKERGQKENKTKSRKMRCRQKGIEGKEKMRWGARVKRKWDRKRAKKTYRRERE